MKTTLRNSVIVALAALFTFAPAYAFAQSSSSIDSRSRDADMASRLMDLERQNHALRSEMIDLKLQVHDIDRGDDFAWGSALLTFGLSAALVTASFYGAEKTFGDSAKEFIPGASSLGMVGVGALAAAGPSLLAGLGNGFDSTPVVSVGMTVNVLLALVPWVAGATAQEVETTRSAIMARSR